MLPQLSASVGRTPSATAPRQGVAASFSLYPTVCSQVTYENGTVCVNVSPLGQRCASIAGLPSGSGTANVCATYEPPSSAKICATVDGVQLPCVTV